MDGIPPVDDFLPAGKEARDGDQGFVRARTDPIPRGVAGSKNCRREKTRRNDGRAGEDEFNSRVASRDRTHQIFVAPKSLGK